MFRSNLGRLGIAALLPALCGCPSVAPPTFQIPTADLALTRLHETQACGRGIQASAKIDHFGKKGRIRGELLLFATSPANLRMDAVSPFGVTLATLTTDGNKFALADLREKNFFVGPASACNIARLTTVPIPGHALVNLLRGDAPVLKHSESSAQIAWSSAGYYTVKIPSSQGADEELHIAPHPQDFQSKWESQRLRLLRVIVRQQGIVLYDAELEGHAPGKMASPRVDEDGIEPPIPVSGPMCQAELPRTIHLDVPESDEDVLFRYDSVTWNPPLPPGVFTQPRPAGMMELPVDCGTPIAPAPTSAPPAGPAPKN
ncbi:MAG: hypothetical protein U0174_10210 [Polyangiaceae bacterium]